jgi:hypothetical protein
LVGKSEWKRLLLRPRLNWEVNITVELKKKGKNGLGSPDLG